MINSNPDMLMYIGMADAYGMAAEYLKNPDPNHMDEINEFTHYVKHPRHQQKSGQYTDDTEMSAANAHVLINNSYPFTEIQFADSWFNEFKRGGKRKGYSKNFQSILESCECGQDILDKIQPTSEKNGACMRAVPFGVLSKVEEVVDTAVLQAKITHDTPPAIFAAKLVALMSHFALYTSDPFSKLKDFCSEFISNDERNSYGHIFNTAWSGRITGELQPVSVATVHAVYDLLINKTSLKDMLFQTIEWGGDTDSCAAIAWGVASSRYKFEALPAFLEYNLEGGNPHTGASYLRSLGSKLMLKYG